MGLMRTLLAITNHPLNRGVPVQAIGRFVRWQLGSRLLGYDVAVPFVGGTRLVVSRGMTGATGNVYCGMHELADMAFVMHTLRPDDLFIDIGANIGSYTVLAAGVARATVMAFEPVPSTFERLMDNVHLNRLMGRTACRNMALGEHEGNIRFTSSRDTTNHALPAGTEPGIDTIEVPVARCDDVLDGQSPIVIKIDVEGYETAVCKGAENALTQPSLIGVLMELTGCGHRYGFDEDALHDRMLNLGFATWTYDPFNRTFHDCDKRRQISGNTLYIRDILRARARVEGAPKIRVLSRQL